MNSSISLFTLFFLVHIAGVTLLHIYVQFINPIPLWQWGVGYGGDEINFINYMKFYFKRFDIGNYGFDYLTYTTPGGYFHTASDYSVWVYLLAWLTYPISNSEITIYFVPKLLSSFFISLTCFYTVLFAKKISNSLNIKLLVIFLLLTPDFYYLASGVFRAPIIAYSFIMVLFLAKMEKNKLELRSILYFLPFLCFILLWLLPNLKIFLNLLLICIIIAILISQNRWTFVAVSIIGLSLLVFNSEFFLKIITLLSHDSYGSLAKRLFNINTPNLENGIGHYLLNQNYFFYFLSNILQFFITIPFWAPMTAYVNEARAPIETIVILIAHFSMSLLLPGLLSLKKNAPKTYLWILYPIIFYSFSMCLTGTVLIRWRLPIMSLIVLLISVGFQAHYTKLKISYFIGLIGLYLLYFVLKGNY